MPIKNRISEFQKDMQTWRHHFHEFPELAYKEMISKKNPYGDGKASERIFNFLKKLNR